MPETRVQFAELGGVCVVRLEGQMRMTLCPTLEGFFQRKLGETTLRGIMVDLSAAESLDSTTYGVLVRMSQCAARRLGHLPSVFGASDDVRREFESYDLCDQFHFVSGAGGECRFENVAECESGEDEMRRCVIAAHRELMALSEKNRETFSSLVSTLESGSD